MSAMDALRAAYDAGIVLRVEGDGLLLGASAPPPAAVLDRLARHKADLIALLRRDDDWSADDWRAFFDERAGIAEFDGGLSRATAEAAAFACCISKWLNRHPVWSPPGRCLACGQAESAHEQLLPIDAGTNGQVWLHDACWRPWHAERAANAAAALEAMGMERRSIEP